MKQSYKILSLFGIDIEVHWLFLLTIVIFLFLSPVSALLFCIIFVFVTLHEISHSLVAKTKGVKVKKIVLLPIGGMAMIENIEELDPWSEIKMAFAGPLFNFVVVIICVVISGFLNYPLIDKMQLLLSENAQINLAELIFLFVVYANAMLGVFNLCVPAFPLDGGRILRGILALKFDYVKATRIAKNVGIVFGIIIALLGFFGGNLLVGVIGLFIIFGANAEYEGVVLSGMLSRIKLSELITRDVIMLEPEMSIQEALKELMYYRESCGMLKGNRVFDISYLANIPKNRLDSEVSKVSRKIPEFDKNSKIHAVVKKMTEENFPMVLIKQNNKTLGVVYLEDIQKKLRMIQLDI